MIAIESPAAFEPAGHCPRCSYRTNPGVCPECGRNNPRVRPGPPPPHWQRIIRRSLQTLGVVGILALAGCGTAAGVFFWWPESHLRSLSIQSTGPIQRCSNYIVDARQTARGARANAIMKQAESDVLAKRGDRWTGRYFSNSSPWASIDAQGRFADWGDCFLYGPRAIGRVQRVSPSEIRLVGNEVDTNARFSRSVCALRIGTDDALCEIIDLPHVLNSPKHDTRLIHKLKLREHQYNRWFPEPEWPPIDIAPDLLHRFKLPRPIETTQSRVVAQTEPGSEPQPPSCGCVMSRLLSRVTFRLELGHSDGVFVGLGFWTDHPELKEAGSPPLVVTEVHDTYCFAEAIYSQPDRRFEGVAPVPPSFAPGIRCFSGR